MTEYRYRAHFTPEAWVRNQVIEIDPAGPQDWDCTAFAVARKGMDEYLAEMLRVFGDYGDGWVLDASDVFKDDPAAPEWVRLHRGPFTITIFREEA